MKTYEDIDELIEIGSDNLLSDFLNALKDAYQRAIEGEFTRLQISDLTLYWYVNEKAFAAKLMKMDRRVKSLSTGLDVTHPSLTQEQYIRVLNDLITLADQILAEHYWRRRKITKENVDGAMGDAILAKDEPLMKKFTIRAMRIYLRQGKDYTKDCLDGFGMMSMLIPIEEKWKDGFPFTDMKLKYVLEELGAIETVPEKRARENCKRFILYLQDKDYES